MLWVDARGAPDALLLLLFLLVGLVVQPVHDDRAAEQPRHACGICACVAYGRPMRAVPIVSAVQRDLIRSAASVQQSPVNHDPCLSHLLLHRWGVASVATGGQDRRQPGQPRPRADASQRVVLSVWRHARHLRAYRFATARLLGVTGVCLAGRSAGAEPLVFILRFRVHEVHPFSRRKGC